MLTKKQRDLLLYIHEHIQKDDIPPSFDEMREALDLKSKSGIHRLINALVERGYLERLPHRARALEIKKLPEGYRPRQSDSSAAARTSRQIASVYSDAGLKTAALSDARVETIPLLGKIAAGTPIEAIRDEGQTLDIPAAFIGSGEYYALQVEGDSMINAGIHDRDTVIIRRCDRVEDGVIAVALVDGEDVTLKRFRRAGDRVLLEPANEAYEIRVLEPQRVQIQGRLVSLMRHYH